MGIAMRVERSASINTVRIPVFDRPSKHDVDPGRAREVPLGAVRGARGVTVENPASGRDRLVEIAAAGEPDRLNSAWHVNNDFFLVPHNLCVRLAILAHPGIAAHADLVLATATAQP